MEMEGEIMKLPQDARCSTMHREFGARLAGKVNCKYLNDDRTCQAMSGNPLCTCLAMARDVLDIDTAKRYWQVPQGD
ncbi:MAG TPA: hypothetical protein VMX18_00230 [Candidatus Bipolaricaulota bacterium]|nr:hypothetical protein [Candidatus Bipolaricaulota bacterium]